MLPASVHSQQLCHPKHVKRHKLQTHTVTDKNCKEDKSTICTTVTTNAVLNNGHKYYAYLCIY